MARYMVFPASPQGFSLEPFELDCTDDRAAWYAAGGFLRAGTADVWQETRFVGALALTAYHVSPSGRVVIA